jgi:hypothetical protein
MQKKNITRANGIAIWFHIKPFSYQAILQILPSHTFFEQGVDSLHNLNTNFTLQAKVTIRFTMRLLILVNDLLAVSVAAVSGNDKRVVSDVGARVSRMRLTEEPPFLLCLPYQDTLSKSATEGFRSRTTPLSRPLIASRLGPNRCRICDITIENCRRVSLTNALLYVCVAVIPDRVVSGEMVRRRACRSAGRSSAGTLLTVAAVAAICKIPLMTDSEGMLIYVFRGLTSDLPRSATSGRLVLRLSLPTSTSRPALPTPSTQPTLRRTPNSRSPLDLRLPALRKRASIAAISIR